MMKSIAEGVKMSQDKTKTTREEGYYNKDAFGNIKFVAQKSWICTVFLFGTSRKNVLLVNGWDNNMRPINISHLREDGSHPLGTLCLRPAPGDGSNGDINEAPHTRRRSA